MSIQVLSFRFIEKTGRTDTHFAMNVMNGKGLEERPTEVKEPWHGFDGRRYGGNRGERKKKVEDSVTNKPDRK